MHRVSSVTWSVYNEAKLKEHAKREKWRGNDSGKHADIVKMRIDHIAIVVVQLQKNQAFLEFFFSFFKLYMLFFFAVGLKYIHMYIWIERVKSSIQILAVFCFLFFAVYGFLWSYWAERRVQKRLTSRKHVVKFHSAFPTTTNNSKAKAKPFLLALPLLLSLSPVHSLLLHLLIFFSVLAASSFACIYICVCCAYVRERASVYMPANA